MSPMSRRLRLLLVLFLSLALDMAPPVGAEALEIFEEFEEAAHRARSRRVVILVREERPPAPSPDAARLRVPRPVGAAVEIRRWALPVHPAREAPSSVAETPPAPEEH